MKEIMEEYGDLIMDGVALACIIAILSICFFCDTGVFSRQLLLAFDSVL